MPPKHLCGFSIWHPEWLQKFANAKTFIVVYGLLGMMQGMAFTYFIVTLTTIEKRFKIPSGTTGIISSGNELSQILLSLILSYVGGQRNRPKWISYGMIFCAMSCFILASPHFIYGPGEDSLQLTAEYLNNSMMNSSSSHFVNDQTSQLCFGVVSSALCDELFSMVPLVLFFFSQFVLGIGQTLYYSLGQSYLDDNTLRSNTPMLLAYAMSLRMCGPVAGYGLGYMALKSYIDPTKTPLIDNTDPRWLGAWWMGWIFLGIPMLLLSFLIRMFPSRMQQKQDPCAANEEEPLDGENRERNIEVNGLVKSDKLKNLKGFPAALMRLLKNKVLIFNILASIFYALGSAGYTYFLSKYIEVQFNKSRSNATILIGPLTIAGMVVGFILSGTVIKRYRPGPRKLFLWNVIVGTGFIFGLVCYSFLGCENSSHTNMSSNITSECNTNCHCDEVAYSPVCSVKSGTTFYSPCHAACNQWDNRKKVYSGCSCAAKASAEHTSDLTKIVKSTSVTNAKAALPFTNTTINTIPTEIDDEIKHRKDRTKTNDRNFLESIVTPGPCLAECANTFYLFTFIMLTVNWLNSTGRIGNILLTLRAVANEDKAFSLGLALMLVSLFAFTPGPIVYGYIIDSTCLVWSYECGNRGNCQLYDTQKFRIYINMTAIAFTFVAVVFDVLVWRHAKNMKLYIDLDESDNRKRLQQIE